jgi:nucleotidyltransferase substrate binding protein (TIGR01987 family)
MHDIRWQQRFNNFNRAMQKLTDAVTLSQERALSELEQQGLIQGFEFVHELAWNVLKDFLEYDGIQDLIGSRSTVRAAFKHGILADGEVWMAMIESRNLSSHTYNVSTAKTLVTDILTRYYPAFQEFQSNMEKRIAC